MRICSDSANATGIASSHSSNVDSRTSARCGCRVRSQRRAAGAACWPWSWQAGPIGAAPPGVASRGAGRNTVAWIMPAMAAVAPGRFLLTGAAVVDALATGTPQAGPTCAAARSLLPVTGPAPARHCSSDAVAPGRSGKRMGCTCVLERSRGPAQRQSKAAHCTDLPAMRMSARGRRVLLVALRGPATCLQAGRCFVSGDCAERPVAANPQD